MVAGGGLSACLLLCVEYDQGVDGHGRIGLGAGAEIGINWKAGVTSETQPGFYLGSTCTAGLGPVGVYVEGGIEEHGPLGYGGLGLAPGLKLGCNIGGGWGW